MGAHSRPRGRHRGEPAPLIAVDLGASAVRAGVVLASGAAAASVVVAGAGAAGAAPGSVSGATTRTTVASATPADFAALRACESGDDYSINTGNGFYGAYQFDLRTWDGLGYSGLPSAAAPATQDQAAETLQSQRGWEPWPACSAKLGLGSTTPSTGTLHEIIRLAPAPAPVKAVVRTSTRVSVHVAGGVPAFPGSTLTPALIGQRRSDVMVWQARMARRGWRIRVDGYFGPQTARIATEFAAEKSVAAPTGTVTAAVWTAAWTAPITR